MNPIPVCLMAIALAVSPAPALADVYRWVDEDGVVHFSDEPRDGAERIEVQEPPTVRLPRPQSSGTSAATGGQAEDDGDEAAGYERFAITSPTEEQTIQSAPGEVPVSLSLEPGLREGHRIRLLLDGSPADVSPLRSLQVTLGPLDRGPHTLAAEVTDASGRVRARTETVTFYLHRPSVNLPSRQGN